jgi:hypothetical protein
MSRRESDREDLLREATALVERAEVNVSGFGEPIVIGFRQDGAASFFFGADPVYQFNAAGELRRVYLAGLLYKAQRGKLIALRRERSATEVTLLRTELSDADTAALLQAMQQRLQTLREAFSTGSFTVAGQVPPNADVPARANRWLIALPDEIPIARVPNLGPLKPRAKRG